MPATNRNKPPNTTTISITSNTKALSALRLFFIEFSVNVLAWDKDIEMRSLPALPYFVRFNKALFNPSANSLCAYFFDFCIFADPVNFIVFIGHSLSPHPLVISRIVTLGVFFNSFCVIFPFRLT